MTASPFTAPWLSASPTHPWRWSSRRAQPPRRARPRAPRPSAGSAHPDDPGQGAPGLAEGGRLRPAFAWGDRHVPLQSCHRSRPARPDTAGPEDRSPGRPRDEEWLVIEWPDGEVKPAKYWLAIVPPDMPFDRLVDLAKLRW